MGKIILIAVFLLAGCTTTQYVHIPPAEPPVITRPALDTDYLKPEDTADIVIKAHRLTIKKLQAWGMELEQALNLYRK